MITEAIVLAGGLGTRLKQVLPDLPKSLAPIDGRPFLSYLLDYFKKEGITRFVFALGYKTELIEDFVKGYLPKGSYSFSIEDEPLGTGGAIYKACKQISNVNSLVLNADTFFAVSLSYLNELHEQETADCTLTLKPMTNFDRYGAVTINEKKEVIGFSEKKYQTGGLINGGVYALNAQSFIKKTFPPAFSFEKDYLEMSYQKEKILGYISEGYFIDIGIPEDYQRALSELPQLNKHNQ
jgi:D-glycero-alpha-D-manno-heptose 1-phosphate guanylyltransferase